MIFKNDFQISPRIELGSFCEEINHFEPPSVHFCFFHIQQTTGIQQQATVKTPTA
jgi:hypothetical protein